AYTDVGVRVVLAPAVADVVFFQTVPGLLGLLPADLRTIVAGMQAAPTKGLLELSERAIRRWNGSAQGRVRVAVAPTIPNQASDEFMDGCRRLVREYGVGVHTHLAESKVQVIESRRRWGKTIVARLAEHGLLGPGFVGAHGGRRAARACSGRRPVSGRSRPAARPTSSCCARTPSSCGRSPTR